MELKNFDANNVIINKLVKGELQVLTQNLDDTEKLECRPPT